ncbi:MAG: hypothetical protein K0R57_6318 [Paenibacillaceae bacterium]|jgi:hypothetical protein|nr:hypothetical protein [Paenibacillaceae bacterium]
MFEKLKKKPNFLTLEQCAHKQKPETAIWQHSGFDYIKGVFPMFL